MTEANPAIARDATCRPQLVCRNLTAVKSASCWTSPNLRQRFSTLPIALAPGADWVRWHLMPFALMGRGANWILRYALSAVAVWVMIAGLFENTRPSIPVAVLFHTMIKLSSALFRSDWKGGKDD